jgi:DNA invertase Pin-like site-specific DNA recombinase
MTPRSAPLASIDTWLDPTCATESVQIIEANLNHLRTREGMAIAKRKGKLRGKQSKLPESAQRSIRRRYATGEVSLADLAEEYGVGRSTIYRVIHHNPS